MTWCREGWSTWFVGALPYGPELRNLRQKLHRFLQPSAIPSYFRPQTHSAHKLADRLIRKPEEFGEMVKQWGVTLVLFLIKNHKWTEILLTKARWLSLLWWLLMVMRVCPKLAFYRYLIYWLGHPRLFCSWRSWWSICWHRWEGCRGICWCPRVLSCKWFTYVTILTTLASRDGLP